MDKQVKQENRKRIFNISEIKSTAVKIKSEVASKGHPTGFVTLDPLISYKEGYSTIVYSYSHQGKTQFVIEESVNMALESGIITALYLTEAGKMAETILDIAQTYLQKNFESSEVTDEELLEALDWADKYFVIYNSEDSLWSIREIYKTVREFEKETGKKIGNLIIDHYGNLDKSSDSEQKFLKIDENVKYTLQAVTRCSSKYRMHTFILFHLRDTPPVKCDKSGIYYLPMPEHHNISGGQQANFLGQQMIAIWRPVYHPSKLGICDPDGVPYEENETIVIVSKSKPKHIGRLGKGSIYFDKVKQSYYEVEGGISFYRNQSKGGRKYVSPNDNRKNHTKVEDMSKKDFISSMVNSEADFMKSLQEDVPKAIDVMDIEFDTGGAF